MHLPLQGQRILRAFVKQWRARQSKFVKVVNNDNAHCSDIKLYTLNILSSDYCSALKLKQKFEKILEMLWYNFHNDWYIVS